MYPSMYVVGPIGWTIPPKNAAEVSWIDAYRPIGTVRGRQNQAI